MAKTVTSKVVCNSCGADVRQGAVFCVSCGESISSKEGPVRPRTNNGGRADETQLEKADVVAESDEHVVTANEVQANYPGESKPNLTSAASLRKKVKAYNRKPVEVTWTERESFPTAYFAATVILVIFSAAMLILAWILK